MTNKTIEVAIEKAAEKYAEVVRVADGEGSWFYTHLNSSILRNAPIRMGAYSTAAKDWLEIGKALGRNQECQRVFELCASLSSNAADARQFRDMAEGLKNEHEAEIERLIRAATGEEKP